MNGTLAGTCVLLPAILFPRCVIPRVTHGRPLFEPQGAACLRCFLNLVNDVFESVLCHMTLLIPVDAAIRPAPSLRRREGDVISEPRRSLMISITWEGGGFV